MHLPDGFLAPQVWAPLAASGAIGVALAARRATQTLPPERVPLLGVLGAFVFAAQMVNFPVASGTSGHLTGAVLVAVLVGPSAAALVMTAVLAVQCLLFQDGGVTALGANVFNMALVECYGGWGIYWLGARLLPGRTGRSLAVFAACFLAVVAAASLVAVELWLSGVVDLGAALVAMGGVHAIIGVGEGAATLAVLAFLGRVRPDLLETGGST
jgi:cobalt/nickel transport system permease protein